MAASFTRDEILAQMDKRAEEFTFPMLDNGYVYPVDVRLSAFRDDQRWSIAVELIGFHYKMGGHDGINNCLYLFGNCIERTLGTTSPDFFSFTNDGPGGPTFDDEVGIVVRPETRSIRIRETVVPIDLSPETFAEHGIELEEPPTVLACELLRLVVQKHRDLILLSKSDDIRCEPGRVDGDRLEDIAEDVTDRSNLPQMFAILNGLPITTVVASRLPDEGIHNEVVSIIRCLKCVSCGSPINGGNGSSYLFWQFWFGRDELAIRCLLGRLAGVGTILIRNHPVSKPFGNQECILHPLVNEQFRGSVAASTGEQSQFPLAGLPLEELQH